MAPKEICASRNGRRRLTASFCRAYHSSLSFLEGDSWTVYRFLTQHHPELERDTALSALLRPKIDKVLAAAENTAGAFS